MNELLKDVERHPSNQRDARSRSESIGGMEANPIEHQESELIDTEFFAPAASDLLDSILADYKQRRSYIDQIADIISGDLGGCVHYFIDGCREDSRYSPSVEKLFEKKTAYAALNSDFWSRTLGMTDVYDCMPQKRREEWNKQITEMTCLDFTEETVRPTIETLLSMRSQYLAERVDGIFRNLSGLHVTNSPAAFGKRMIISYMTSYYGDKTGYINDLRCVIAKFMGRDMPKWYETAKLVSALKSNTGEWHTVDGGALRIRLYKKGTAHLEVHPDMAWRLNSILASLYPHAIPSEFRTKPKKQIKAFTIMARPLPFAVLELIAEGRFERNNLSVFSFNYGIDRSCVAYQEALRVLISIGGVLARSGDIEFDYHAQAVIAEIINSGCIPDQKSHQYYPTPESIARTVIELADIGPEDTVLEPSAGQGGISDFLPKERTVCVEISDLHCKILDAKGLKTVRDDFIDWSHIEYCKRTSFDRIVMNPPFSEGRWKAHLEAAYGLLGSGGRLVAVLPASAKNKVSLPNCEMSWSGTYSGEFAGTGVSVVILTATKQGMQMKTSHLEEMAA
jgi:hypothetical protein